MLNDLKKRESLFIFAIQKKKNDKKLPEVNCYSSFC